MSIYTNELRHGRFEEVYYILDNYELSTADLRVALMNAFSRIDDLEKEIISLKAEARG